MTHEPLVTITLDQYNELLKIEKDSKDSVKVHVNRIRDILLAREDRYGYALSVQQDQYVRLVLESYIKNNTK